VEKKVQQHIKNKTQRLGQSRTGPEQHDLPAAHSCLTSDVPACRGRALLPGQCSRRQFSGVSPCGRGIDADSAATIDPTTPWNEGFEKSTCRISSSTLSCWVSRLQEASQLPATNYNKERTLSNVDSQEVTSRKVALQLEPQRVGPFFSVAHYLYATAEKVKGNLTRFSVNGREPRRTGGPYEPPTRVRNCIAEPRGIKWGLRKRRKTSVALDPRWCARPVRPKTQIGGQP